MLSDRDAICHLIYTYAERIDAGDFIGVGELLAHASVTFEGYDAAVSGIDADSRSGIFTPCTSSPQRMERISSKM